MRPTSSYYTSQQTRKTTDFNYGIYDTTNRNQDSGLALPTSYPSVGFGTAESRYTSDYTYDSSSDTSAYTSDSYSTNGYGSYASYGSQATQGWTTPTSEYDSFGTAEYEVFTSDGLVGTTRDPQEIINEYKRIMPMGSVKG